MMPDRIPADIVRDLKLADDLTPYFNRTDQGNAERLVHRHGDDLLHVEKWDRWFPWDGSRWQADETGEVVRLAKKTVKATYHDADPGDGRPVDVDL